MVSYDRIEMPIESALELLQRASRFDFPYGDHWTMRVTVERRSDNQWAVCNLGTRVLNAEGHWEYETLDSGHSEEFIQRTRFDLITAVQHAKAQVEKFNSVVGKKDRDGGTDT